MNMFTDAIFTPLKALGRLPEWIRTVRTSGLPDYVKSTRVEPIVLVDQAAVNLPYIQDVMSSLTMIFSGYYLQAVSISVNVGRVDVVRTLEKLNPSRSPAENAGMLIGDIMLSSESYTYKLPTMPVRPNFEAFSSVGYTDDIDEQSTARVTLGKDTVKEMQNAANLSVGVTLEVNIESEGDKATIPISVRLISSIISTKVLNNILACSSKDITVKERYHAWRSGQLEFVKDLIFCQDLIDAHRQTLMKDDSGQYMEIIRRKNTNKVSAILSGNPSVATASNMVVTTTESMARLQLEIGGKLSNYKVRERMFHNTYIMLMVVIDTQWERATIYTRGISIPTEISIKSMKTANKGGNTDVAEILKAYQLGNSPTL